MKVVVLSAGAVASDVARDLATSGVVDEMVIADIDVDRARTVAHDVGSSAVVGFDASDAASIGAVIAGADVVFNGVGPFYRYGMNIIRAAVEAGVHYVDVCDEFDVAEELMNSAELDQAAKDAGVTVLIGMGSAPGLTNVAARWAVDDLSSAHSVSVVLGVPHMVDLGVTINEHMIHSMTGNVTQFLDGEYRKVPAWGDPRSFEFQEPFGTHAFGYMGHPEGVTLPHYLPGLRNASVRFGWFEPEGAELWKTLDRLGFHDNEVPEGMAVSPRVFLSRYRSSEAGRKNLALDEAGGYRGSVWHVAVDGEQDGVPTRIAIEGHVLGSRPRSSAAQVTSIPAAAGVLELIEGKITRRGILSPEACIDPEPFVRKVAVASNVALYRTVTQTSCLN